MRLSRSCLLLFFAGAGLAQAQPFCYQFSSSGGRFSVSVTNLPGPSGTNTVGPGGISNGTSYQLSAVSGNTATLSSGSGNATAPPLALWLINATGGAFFNTLTIYLGGPNNSIVGGVSLLGPTNFLPARGLAPLPPLSELFLANVFVGGTSYELTSIVSIPCAAGTNTEKSLGNPNGRSGSVCCGDPVNLGTGSMYDHVVDYQTAGANKLTYVRYYNSLSAAATVARRLGVRWRSNYDRYLIVNSATSVTAERYDGQQLRFTLAAGRWTAESDVDLQLSVANGVWTLTNSDDSVETYTTFFSGVAPLQSLRARNGYSQTLQYSPAGDLTSVRDSYNRTLTLDYTNSLLQRLTTPDGLVVSYSYNASAGPGGTPNRLVTVAYNTTPATSLTYTYGNASVPFAITQVTDENGNNFASWTYDAQGRALSSENAGGANRMRYAYNDNDGSRTVTNAFGHQTVYRFSTLQGVPKVTQMDRLATATTAAATRRFTYDANGHVASETDWSGNLTTFGKDGRGQPTTIVEASGTPQARTTTIAYHPALHLPVTVTSPGLTIAFTYDAAGNMVTQTRTDTTTGTIPYSTQGTARRWTYIWSNGLITSVQGPRTDGAEITKFAYDNAGRLISITGALGHVTTIPQHTPGGLPQTIVDPNNVTTTLTYDRRLRLTSRSVATAAGALTTAYTYDAAGNLTGTQTPDGVTFNNTYDAARRLTQVTDVFNQSIRLTLDPVGNPAAIGVLDGGTPVRARQSTFNALGQRLTGTGGAGQKTAVTLDASGNRLTLTDPLGRVTRQTFDALHRVTAITDPAGGITRLTYDAYDRPLTITAPNGAVTTYVYNGFGDVIQRVSPDTGTTVYRYDASGNLAQMTDARTAVSNYTYDALNRLMAINYPAAPAENVKFVYDEAGYGSSIGRLTTVVDTAGTLHRTYDERGNVLTEARSR